MAPNKNPAIKTINDEVAVDADVDGSGACGRLEERRLLLYRLLIFAILFFAIQKSSGYGKAKQYCLLMLNIRIKLCGKSLLFFRRNVETRIQVIHSSIEDGHEKFESLGRSMM